MYVSVVLLAACLLAGVQVAAYCQNNTCSTQLQDVCGPSQQRGSCRECTNCLSEHEQHLDRFCSAGQETAVFCNASCSAELRCSAALLENCDQAREKGEMDCYMCSGARQSQLAAAGCSSNPATDNLTVAFCTNKTCMSRIGASCSGKASNCFDCARCADAVKESLTGGNQSCMPSETAIFCQYDAHSLSVCLDGWMAVSVSLCLAGWLPASLCSLVACTTVCIHSFKLA